MFNEPECPIARILAQPREIGKILPPSNLDNALTV
jgi:hypothetical protein